MATKITKDVFQSYILTTAKYDFSIYEKRILYRLVETAQSELQGLVLRNNMQKIETSAWGDKHITMPVTDILCGAEDTNYAKAKNAFQSLAEKRLEYEDDKIWLYTGIINSPKIVKGSGLVEFTVADAIWGCILNFTQGYRKFELITAMQFRSVYSMRMYELVSGQRTPLVCSVDELRERFGLLDRYKLTTNFRLRVLDPSKKELDSCSPYTFDYEEIKHGKKVVAYRITPIEQPQFRNQELEHKSLEAQVSGIFIIRKDVYDYLRYNMNFDSREINANKKLFEDAMRVIPDILGALSLLKGKSREAKNPKGYIINALKGKVSDATTGQGTQDGRQKIQTLSDTLANKFRG